MILIKEKNSATGPNSRIGMKLNNPKSIIVEINKMKKIGLWEFNVSFCATFLRFLLKLSINFKVKPATTNLPINISIANNTL